MKKIMILLLTALTACSSPDAGSRMMLQSRAFIDDHTISSAVDAVKQSQQVPDTSLLVKGVKHAASLWRADDGTKDDFLTFVDENFIDDQQKRRSVFLKICGYIESLNGNFNEITLDLRKVLDLSDGEIDNIDRMFGNYPVDAHLREDLFSNKIAFVIALNFPYFTLGEKEALGPGWNREQWAMARLGNMFVSRVPSGLNQLLAEAKGNSEMYIAGYNIYMGHLLTEDKRRLFPEDMILLSHWNLRDELKADYADRDYGKEKQEMIYKVMERIIRQEIPAKVINSPDYEWEPFSNKVTKGGTQVEVAAEPDTRYSHVINNFRAMKALDPYFPEMNTAILRKFSWEMEISQEEVEALFDSYLSSPMLAKLGNLIKDRLGRDLRPYDIWYDGFKTRSSIPEDLLTSRTSSLYPDPASFKAGIPLMLMKLGWSGERAKYIAGRIVVDPARGSGHAWGAMMRGSVSHLRTRISDKGMDYKGYNIAVHEFGHNVEQTISLYDVDNYMIAGVPNTGFTEALAFIFQSRDLMLLGMKDDNPAKDKMKALDAAWSLMEIMGVGMVEMKIWKWLYDNQESTPSQLKEKTISTAIEVWNRYFAPVLGIKDSPVLAIYSHMIDSPLYLPNYSYGQVIEFQIEEYLKGKDFAREIDRMYSQGTLTPQQWMKGAVGEKISAQPILNALEAALK